MYKWCLAATVYHIWRERNSRIFRNHGVDSTSVVNRIVDDVSARLCSWRRIPASVENHDLGLTWGIPRWMFRQ
ncbi:hypothetical protein RHMOL_Rhmol11G0082600 [Rhododendron molle]|nr:hypothetical protein RHMOL_Rhmol11G0082600 [Rhododendron molle]